MPPAILQNKMTGHMVHRLPRIQNVDPFHAQVSVTSVTTVLNVSMPDNAIYYFDGGFSQIIKPVLLFLLPDGPILVQLLSSYEPYCSARDSARSDLNLRPLRRRL